MARELDTEFDGVMSGGVSIGLAVYLALVFYNGNWTPFMTQVQQEKGYLEFLLAAFIIYKLLEIQTTRPIIGLFVIGAFIIAAQNMMQGVDTSKFASFASGGIDLFGLIGSIFTAA